jgi:hypothetical protein
MKNLGKSIAFSDDQKKRFIALSIVEMATESATRFGNDDSEMRASKILRATRILAEHVGSFGIEVDFTKEAVRYSVSASANTVVEACQKAETLAERIVRIVRELYGEDTHARILEGQNLQGVFKRIVGGDFETLTSIGCVALCHKGVANDVNGFSLLTVTHESIGTIDLRRLISIMQDLGVDASYVINLKAQRVFNENSLIDRLGQGQIWVFSSYFVVNEKSVSTTREAAHRLKNSIEDMTRAGTLRIEKGSTTIRKVGSILARSPVGKKLLFSNSQLIAHVYPIRHYHESVFNDVDEKGSNRGRRSELALHLLDSTFNFDLHDSHKIDLKDKLMITEWSRKI